MRQFLKDEGEEKAKEPAEEEMEDADELVSNEKEH